MATVRPFRGMRFDTQRVGTDLSAVACPAGDAISPARRRILHDRHPYNFCRLVAPVSASEPSPRSQGANWLSAGILQRDESPSFYLVRQSFTATVGGVDDRFTRTGLVCELDHDPLNDANILEPFCESSASLGGHPDMEATRLLLEPALLCYSDPHRTLGPLLEPILASAPLARALDDDSVEHTLHAVSDEAVTEAVQAFFRSRTLLALDGSAWSSPARRLAILVDSTDPGLFPTPVHRVYRGPRNLDPARLEALLAAAGFRMERLPWAGGDAACALLESAREGQHAFVLRWKDATEILLAQAPHGSFPQVSGAAAGSIPHDAAVLDQVVEDAMRSISPTTSTLRVRDAHNAMDVLDHLEDGRLAVLVNACDIATLERLASTGGQIPPETMSFLPRPCCGLVSLPLHG